MDNPQVAIDPTDLALISDPKGYYAALELQPNASPALIRAAYRVRAMELHPDRNDSLSSTPDFQRLQQAFEVLGDPERKAAYDDWAARLATADRPRAAPVAPTPAPRRDVRFASTVVAVTLVVGGLTGWILMKDDAPPPAPVRRQTAPTDPLRLLAATQPMPSSGILQLDLPSEAFANPERLPRLKLTAPREANYLVKLSTWDSHAPVMSVFVRAGDTTEVLVPVGRYRIRLASGAEWYGDALRFGPTTQYTQVETLSEFPPVGEHPVRQELVLERFTGVDEAATTIPASSF